MKIKDLADLAAVVKIGCPWCMDFGYWVLHGHGIPREKIDDELANRLLEHLDGAQLAELTMIIGLENVRARFNSAVGLTGQGFSPPYSRC